MPAQDYLLCPARKWCSCHRTIPLIKLTWSAIEGYWPHLFCVRLWTLATSKLTNNTIMKRIWPISSHLDLKNLDNYPLIYTLSYEILTEGGLPIPITGRKLSGPDAPLFCGIGSLNVLKMYPYWRIFWRASCSFSGLPQNVISQGMV